MMKKESEQLKYVTSPARIRAQRSTVIPSTKCWPSGFRQTLSDFTLALIRYYQYHLMCCLSTSKLQDVSVATVIEPSHEHYIVTRDASGVLNQYYDLYYSSGTLLLIQLLQAIDTTYKNLKFDYVIT
jgi:hypothetical protein